MKAKNRKNYGEVEYQQTFIKCLFYKIKDLCKLQIAEPIFKKLYENGEYRLYYRRFTFFLSIINFYYKENIF